MSQELNKILDSIGPLGSEKRLEYIANANLGERSAAASRVLKKRELRRGRFLNWWRRIFNS